MKMRELILLKISVISLLAIMLWATGCDKAGAAATKNGKANTAVCPMTKADKGSCPMMKESAACEATCSDEQKATCAAEGSCPMMATATDATKTCVDNAATCQEQTTCPVMGKPINKEMYTEYKGHKVYFCCASCKGEFEKNPEKYLDKLPQFKK